MLKNKCVDKDESWLLTNKNIELRCENPNK